VTETKELKKQVQTNKEIVKEIIQRQFKSTMEEYNTQIQKLTKDLNDFKNVSWKLLKQNYDLKTPITTKILSKIGIKEKPALKKPKVLEPAIISKVEIKKEESNTINSTIEKITKDKEDKEFLEKHSKNIIEEAKELIRSVDLRYVLKDCKFKQIAERKFEHNGIKYYLTTKSGKQKLVEESKDSINSMDIIDIVKRFKNINSFFSAIDYIKTNYANKTLDLTEEYKQKPAIAIKKEEKITKEAETAIKQEKEEKPTVDLTDTITADTTTIKRSIKRR
jgi:hypothetical protein